MSIRLKVLYLKRFIIESAQPYDTAQTKDGQVLTRVLVWIGVFEKFPTLDISPADTHPF